MADGLKTYREIFNEHTGIPCHKHENYPELYDQHFWHMRDKEINILELGFGQGGGAQVWLKYFPKATLVCFDSNPEMLEKRKADFDQSRVTFVAGDAGNKGTLNRLASMNGPFDIIMDDCSHRPDHQILAFETLLKNHLKTPGVYLIEDMEQSGSKKFALRKDPNFDKNLKDDYFPAHNFFDYVYDFVKMINIHDPSGKRIENIKKHKRAEEEVWFKQNISEITFHENIVAIHKKNVTPSTKIWTKNEEGFGAAWQHNVKRKLNK